MGCARTGLGAVAGAEAVEVLRVGACRLRSGASGSGLTGAPFRATGFWRRTGVAESGRRRKRPLPLRRGPLLLSPSPSATPTSRTRAPAELWRSSGVFESADVSTSSTAAGSSGRISVSRGGVSFSWACIAARPDWRANGADPDRQV